MTRNNTPAVRVLGGYLWPIESVVDRPEVALSRWRLYEISAAWSGAPTLHLVGWANETTQGQVSSPVHHVDPASRLCVTRSGRRYRLIGQPGHCDDAGFVWGAWKQLNGAEEERDLTDVLWLLLEGATTGGHGAGENTTLQRRMHVDPDLDRSLCSRYPAVFRERHAPASRTAMCWGFCCGNGWYVLIDTLCDEIQRRVDTHGAKDVVALQVKEKFGGLRFYVSGGDQYTNGLIWLADHLSTMVCEDCGAPGLQTGRDWIKTRCAMHDGEDFPLDQTMSYGEGDLVDGLRSVSPEKVRAWDLANQFFLPPVRTRGWRHISCALEAVIRNDTRHNGLPGVVVDALDESEGLRFHWLGGDDHGRVAAMFRFAEAYAARCDRQTGKPAS